MKFSGLIITMLSLFLCVIGFSQSDLVQTAESALESEDFDAAIGVYKKMISEGYESTDVHFNLATAYYKNNQLSHAVLHYLKVLKVKENHREALTNLDIVDNQRASGLSDLPDFFLAQWWKKLTGLLNSTMWSILFFVSIISGIYFFRSWLFDSQKRKRRLGAVALSLLCSLLLFFAASSKHQRETQLQFVVNMDKTTLYIGPDDRSGEVIEIIQGEKLKVLDRRDNWIKVALINKEIGWVAESDVLKV